MRRTFSVVGSAKQLGARQSQYVELKNALNALGLEESKTLESDLVVFVNYNRKFLRKVKNNDSKLVLIRLEPRAVLPIQYKKRIEKKFDLVISPGRQIEEGSNVEFIEWPYKFDTNPSAPSNESFDIKSVIEKVISEGYFEYKNWKLRKHMMVIVAANKVSPTSHSNYRLRRKLATSLPKSDLEVYGALWNSKKITTFIYRTRVMIYSLRSGYLPNLKEIYGDFFLKCGNYINEPRNKHEVLKDFCFSLVIENTSEYCTEKIFDAMINGTIPIYIGPKHYTINLPKNVFIWCSGSLDELQSIFDNVTESECIVMLKSIKDFLQSDAFLLNWSYKNVYQRTALHIKQEMQ